MKKADHLESILAPGLAQAFAREPGANWRSPLWRAAARIAPRFPGAFRPRPPVRVRKANGAPSEILLYEDTTQMLGSGVVGAAASQGKAAAVNSDGEESSSSPAKRPGVLFIHGGGHLFGAPQTVAPFAARIAKGLGAVVASPRYRFAPEHPFPADLDDCHAAWTWLVDNTDALNIDPARLAIAGASAGGGLAAALVQRLHDEGGRTPAAQLLVYPMLDDRTSTDRSLDGKHLLWENGHNHFAWSAYLAPHEPGPDPKPAYAAPGRREDLSGLPPAWIGVGDMDLFLGEDLDYGSRLNKAGVACEIKQMAKAPHGFDQLAPGAEVSRDFHKSAIAFLARHLAVAD
ncbi:MAG: alpha/beta hydrolase [Pseudomonadota bacterium]